MFFEALDGMSLDKIWPSAPLPDHSCFVNLNDAEETCSETYLQVFFSFHCILRGTCRTVMELSGYAHSVLYSHSHSLAIVSSSTTRDGHETPLFLLTYDNAFLVSLRSCGKPCSRGTHNETVRNLALFSSIINGIVMESRLRISIPWDCFQFFNRIKNSITFTAKNSNSQISQSDWHCSNREVWASNMARCSRVIFCVSVD